MRWNLLFSCSRYLSYDDFVTALKNTHKSLKGGGIFRLVMPNLENLINSYLKNKTNGDKQAAIRFIRNTGMGLENRQTGVRNFLESAMGNSRHQWLWDVDSTISELEKVGFIDIRECAFDDSEDEMFKLVEDKDRFEGSLSLEMRK